MDANNISQAGTNINLSNNIPASTPTTSQPETHKALVACVCGLIGLVIGGTGVFALTQLLQEPTDNPICECPKCQTSASQTSLDFDFLKLELGSENIIYSPLSIKNGLALLSTGAAGTTAAEINNVLGDAEIPKYQNVPDALSLANAVFIRETFENDVLSTYTSAVENNYNAEVIYDDFSSSTKMDNWVDQKTFGLINNIGIQPNDDLEMVLANALAIQMDWQHSFDTEDTRGKTFYKADGSEITATTMNEKTSASDINYYIDDDVTMLSMPLKPTDESALEFVAIMPKNNLNDYIDNVGLDTIETLISNATPASNPKDGIIINIPKFKFDYALKFKDDLMSLGISQAFNEELADFSNMASKPLYVSSAAHKANIDFSEKGIKAAAVTAFGIQDSAVRVDETQPVVINIDHPFLFIIRDKNNGAAWFTGAVYQPNLWEDNASEYYKY